MRILEEGGVWIGGYFVSFQEFNSHLNLFKENVLNKAKKKSEKEVHVLDLTVNTVKVSSFLFDANCMGILCLNRHRGIRSHPDNFFYGKPLSNHQIFPGFYIYRLGMILPGSGGNIHDLFPSNTCREVSEISKKIILGKI